MFCSDCRQNTTCDKAKNKPRILLCNKIAIQIAIDAINGGVPFGELDIMKRPKVMNDLVNIVISYIKELRSENGKLS